VSGGQADRERWVPTENRRRRASVSVEAHRQCLKKAAEERKQDASRPPAEAGPVGDAALCPVAILTVILPAAIVKKRTRTL
jgi:hypothetical protein